MKRRYGENCAGSFQNLEYGKTLHIDDVAVTLYPAGHILGSAQVLLEYLGQRVVATGDYKVTPDSTAQAFDLVKCDIFITEATFGLPVFQHPKPEDEIAKLMQSVQQKPERSHLIGAYALGKTQRVIKLIREAGYDDPIFLHGANEKLCDYYQQQNISLGRLEKVSSVNKDTMRGAIVIAPPGALKDRWSRRMPDPVMCYASGWMGVKQRAKQSLVELPLVISDHADWNELTQIIPATEAEQIWITHGREQALVHWCQGQGLHAEPLSIQGREEAPVE